MGTEGPRAQQAPPALAALAVLDLALVVLVALDMALWVLAVLRFSLTLLFLLSAVRHVAEANF